MKAFFSLLIPALLLASPPGIQAADSPPRPHIVFLLADDLGWKDVGYHGSEIKTPNIDRLAASGVKLEQFHVMPVCSPTRCALLTGRYPIRCGLQTGVVRPWANYGLPLKERTLAQALKEAGYRTAITGKWHLGTIEPGYLPTHRGFDHQYGHYLGAIDYFQHTRMGGLDWHRNEKALREEGYTTNLIGAEAVRLIKDHDLKKPLFLYVPFNSPHTPLQAPEEYLKKYEAIKNKRRQTFAGMVTCMDDAIGRIVQALKDRGMAQDTLLIFSSDNGGPISQAANNGPLRAGKGTLYQGGVQVPAWAVWPGKLKAGAVVKEPLHMVDWYPTLVRLAGGSTEQKLPLDGKDLWPVLTEGKPSPHAEILLNVELQRGAIRQGNWKLVARGTFPRAGGKMLDKVELFDLSKDPFEKTDLSTKEPKKVEELLGRLDVYAREAVPARGGRGRQPANFKVPKVWGEKRSDQ
jgi:arylsulfatase A-like enzyme